MEDMPWPQKGDVLLGPGDDWPNNACLNFTKGPESANLYARGYRIGAEYLADYVMNMHRHQDVLVYPIVFMWRHYVELRLKEIIRSASTSMDDSTELKLDHKLHALWKRLRPLVEEIELDADPFPLNAVEEIIAQLDEIDRHSFAFRYPTGKDGAPSLPGELSYINIRNFTEVMQRVANFLDAVATSFSVYLDHKAEMERYYW